MNFYFTPAPESHRKKHKAKAQELRRSQWWKQVLGQGKCYHCEKSFPPRELTMDHLIPLSRGGESNKRNCVPSCKECNSKKGYKTRAELTLEKLSNSPPSSIRTKEALK